MNEHTPGPWQVYTDGTKTFIAAANGRVVVVDLYDENNEPSIEELEANARLIAAAPALLQALKDTREALAAWVEIAEEQDQREGDYTALEEADQAIQKAEGGN